MEVEVNLFSFLRQNRFEKDIVVLAEPATVASLMLLLGIGEHEVESVFVNAKPATFAQSLAQGDRVTLLPLIGGG